MTKANWEIMVNSSLTGKNKFQDAKNMKALNLNIFSMIRSETEFPKNHLYLVRKPLK